MTIPTATRRRAPHPANTAIIIGEVKGSGSGVLVSKKHEFGMTKNKYL